MDRLAWRRMRIGHFGLLAAIVSAALACKTPSDVAPEPAGSASPAASAQADRPSASAAAAGKLRTIEAPAQGTVDSVVRAALAEAAADRRTLVVYVGATWCEPCQHFHQAAARGDLDAEFPRLNVLEFDLDRDRDRLTAAGYVSKYIPLFALPASDGAASGKQIEGGIKGDGAVGFIVPRLKEMLLE
jgi:thiol-disulfide isomerase/thioredoxin